MTLIVTIVFGFGVVLIASALDCTPLLDTFGKVLHGTPITWTGGDCSGGGKTSDKINPPPSK